RGARGAGAGKWPTASPAAPAPAASATARPSSSTPPGRACWNSDPPAPTGPPGAHATGLAFRSAVCAFPLGFPKIARVQPPATDLRRPALKRNDHVDDFRTVTLRQVLAARHGLRRR